MQRYQVVSRPEQAQWPAYRDWLVMHAAEVVLLGNFCSGEVVETEGALLSDYLAPNAESLDRYVVDQAPALRAEAERLYPQVGRSRDLQRVAGRISPAFAWESLGLVDSESKPVAPPSDGFLDLHYVAPWCDDCEEAIGGIAEEMRGWAGRALIAGVYTRVPEMAAWMSRVAPVPWAIEPSEKSENDRMRTFHGFLRQLSADPRRWGVPARYRLYVKGGRFVVSWS